MTIPPDATASATWYIGRDGQQFGPFDSARFAQMVMEGRLRDSDLVWNHGWPEWRPVHEVPDLPGRSHMAAFLPPAGDAAPTPAATAESSTAAAPAVAQPQPGNYVLRHWRGDLTLPVSYWVNVVVLSWLAFLPVAAFGHFADSVDQPAVVFLAFCLFVALIVAVTVWQFVGAWRSADKHVARGGASGWAVAAKVALALGSLAAINAVAQQMFPVGRELSRTAFGSDPLGTFTLTAAESGEVAAFSGSIVYPAARELRAFLEAHPNVRVVRLDSPGGRIGEARRMVDLVAKAGLDTETRGTCASSCTLVLMAGRERTMYSGGRIGFHTPWFPGLDARDFASQVELDKKYLLSRGLPQAFVDKALSTPSDSMWWPNPTELKVARVITRLRVAPEQAEAELLKIDLYRAVQEREPETYGLMRDAVIAAVENGGAVADAAQQVRPKLQALLVRYLPTASDEALYELGAVVRTSLTELQPNPKACIAYLLPQASDYRGNVPLSTAVKERELAAMALVLRSGDPGRSPPPKGAGVEADLERVVDALIALHGANTRLALQAPTGGRISDAARCQVFRDYYAEIMKLPPTRAAALMRFVLT